MKNTLILFSLSIITFSIVYYISGCNDPTGPLKKFECQADTTITRTDEFGNILGGDTTDWCMNHDSSSVSFGPAYPNPAGFIYRVKFSVPIEDTVKIYLLNTCYDTVTYFQERVLPGYYFITVNDTVQQHRNTYQRLYFKSKHFFPSSYCRFYGDVKIEY